MHATARAANMRALCGPARSGVACSVLKIFQRPAVLSGIQPTYALAAASLPAPQQLQQACYAFASSRTLASRTPRFVVNSGEGSTDSMESNLVELEVKIEGMKCGGCSSRVEAALKSMEHVKAVQVDLESKLAIVEVEADNLIDAMNMLPEFLTTIKELGFEAEPHIEYQL